MQPILKIYFDMWKQVTGKIYVISYALIWSLALFYITFRSFLSEGFVLPDSIEDSYDDYIFPLMTAFTLFIFDIIWGVILQTCEKWRFVFTLIAFLVFFFSFTISITGELLSFRVCFILSWASLTFLKVLWTSIPETNYANVSPVKED